MNDSIRDKRGRLKKGAVINPKGTNGWTTLKPLLNALNKAYTKKDANFWDMVAKKAQVSDTVLVALLKKMLPDKSERDTKGIGANNYIIVRSNSPLKPPNKRIDNTLLDKGQGDRVDQKPPSNDL